MDDNRLFAREIVKSILFICKALQNCNGTDTAGAQRNAMKYDYIWAPMSYGASGATDLYQQELV